MFRRLFGTHSFARAHVAKSSRVQQAFNVSHRTTLLLIFGTCSYLAFALDPPLCIRIKTKRTNREERLQMQRIDIMLHSMS